jgi:ParB-like chromosome segregation protein Spo0J
VRWSESEEVPEAPLRPFDSSRCAQESGKPDVSVESPIGGDLLLVGELPPGRLLRMAEDGVLAPRIPPGPPVVEVPVRLLGPGFSPRSTPVSDTHVAMLMERAEEWPPIVLRRSDHALIDGHHRVEAARRLRLPVIGALFFEGTDHDCYVEAIDRNIRHGLPLSLRERKTAASRLLAERSDWSDRQVAVICGLSPTTVGGLRAGAVFLPVSGANGSGATGASDRRLGKDGRSRPVDAPAVRRRIREVVQDNPSASVRAVARIVGASPETVRSVRLKMRSAESSSAEPFVCAEVPSAFQSTGPGRAFLAWFSKTEITPEDLALYATSVPPERATEVIAEARRRATSWRDFADRIEARAR